MHFWLPPAHAGAPAPVSALLSALVVKASFYLTLRLWVDLFGNVARLPVAQLLGVLGAGAIVWGAIQALRADRLKTLIAYSTVAQLGYLFLLFPLASVPAVARAAWLGAIVFALSHALAKAAMFLAAGRIQQLAGEDRLDRLAGIGQRAPLAVSATALAGVSLMGLPPSGGFAGKWMLLVAGVESGQWWWALVLVGGGLLTAAYLFRFWRIAIASADSPGCRGPVNWRLEIPAFALGAAAVLLVFFATQVVALLEIGAPFPTGATAEVGP
jgi:formate hydrogenlyase subunit 3/multisubunit Na+/H+ antiporter MnhD subunit